MDLKIKDVAELLSVSETTIRRWLTDGKIPAYRINGQYRFSRMEIEDWVMSQRLGKGSEGSKSAMREEIKPDGEKNKGSHQFSLYRALHKGGIFYDVPGETKEEVIHAAMQRIAQPHSMDADVLTDLLLDREKLMPTALNNGVGIPHTRDFLLDHAYDIIALVFPKTPVEYGALDGKPVHSMFFLFASGDKRHLHLLAKVAHFTSNPEAIEILESRPEKKELLNIIKEWELHQKLPQLV